MTSFLITAKRTNRFSSLEKILVHTVHEGEFSGIPATGKELEWTAIEIFQVSEGKVKARWEMADVLGFMQQLGMELKPKEEKK